MFIWSDCNQIVNRGIKKSLLSFRYDLHRLIRLNEIAFLPGYSSCKVIRNYGRRTAGGPCRKPSRRRRTSSVGSLAEAANKYF